MEFGKKNNSKTQKKFKDPKNRKNEFQKLQNSFLATSIMLQCNVGDRIGDKLVLYK